jgi:hypothetical protein
MLTLSSATISKTVNRSFRIYPGQKIPPVDEHSKVAALKYPVYIFHRQRSILLALLPPFDPSSVSGTLLVSPALSWNSTLGFGLTSISKRHDRLTAESQGSE